MRLGTTKYFITRSKDGFYYSNLFGKWSKVEIENLAKVKVLYKTFKSNFYTEEMKLNALNEIINGQATETVNSEISETTEKEIDRNQVVETLQKLIDFFKEFDFEPSFRFVNTLARISAKSKSSARNYIISYFELSDNGNTVAIQEKIKSSEFADLLSQLAEIDTTKKINNRLKIYYGSAGTGKTTKAIEECGKNCIPCHSAMLPTDIMEDFAFDDGKAGFHPSAFWNAMKTGTPILLDEINLLPFETLRFLQNILDGKKQFTYKGQIVDIADGFRVVGTMNLVVNNCTYSLPEPLIDRCEEIKKFSLSGENLVSALI